MDLFSSHITHENLFDMLMSQSIIICYT